jgi:uncharacterized protein (TIGR02145 family)
MFASLNGWLPTIKNTSRKTRISDLILWGFLLSGIMFLNSCRKDPTVPVLTTDAASDITVNSATIGGNITDDGGDEVTARGICWGTASSPTMDDDFKPSGTGTGSFTCTIEDLDPNTQYYARAYAQNSVGIAYGNEIEFTTIIGIPQVTTGQVSGISATTAICGGEILSDGGGPITEKGICWSTATDPDINDSHAAASTGSQNFSCSMTGLSDGTKYYVRAYAKNSAWTVYGEVISFNTKMSDIEGNLYSTVTIGSQLWMAENLRSTKYNDNSPIPYVPDNEDWIVLSTPAYCWFNNDIQYKETFGALYNWYTVGTGKLCPDGWHVPTDEEFMTLEISLGMAAEETELWDWRGTDQGTQMKSTSGWIDGGNGTNSSGFNALAAGYRYGATGAYNALGLITYWWSSEHNNDQGRYRRIDGSDSRVYRSVTSKRGGKYIRCVKDQ